MGGTELEVVTNDISRYVFTPMLSGLRWPGQTVIGSWPPADWCSSWRQGVTQSATHTHTHTRKAKAGPANLPGTRTSRRETCVASPGSKSPPSQHFFSVRSIFICCSYTASFPMVAFMVFVESFEVLVAFDSLVFFQGFDVFWRLLVPFSNFDAFFWANNVPRPSWCCTFDGAPVVDPIFSTFQSVIWPASHAATPSLQTMLELGAFDGEKSHI